MMRPSNVLDFSPPLLELENLSISFPDRNGGFHYVVQSLSFSLRPGEVVGLVGESGSGKSVSARAIVGLSGAQARVSAKKLTFAGQNLLQFKERDWRALRGADIGFVLQDALVSLDPLRKIGDEVAEALCAHGWRARREKRQQVVDILRSVGIPDPELRMQQYVHELSGGLRQRALIATAIAAKPRLIIADEPTTALDASVQAQVLNLLRSRVADGSALLIISHDMGVIGSIADRVLVMRDGRVVEAGSTRTVLKQPSQPYTRRLLRAIPSRASRGYRLSDSGGDTQNARAKLPERRINKSTIALSVEGVSKTFTSAKGGVHHAVRNVSLALHEGETVGLVGESGSGKSTLGRIIMGLTRADRGQVLLEEQPWSILNEAARRSRRSLIQTVTQDTLGVFDPRYSVEMSLREALGETRKLSAQAREREISRLVDAVGLARKKLGSPLRDLSGGQRQRVAIARALATQPRILICDEPVSALDISVQAQVLDLLADLQSEFGLSYLFITHDLGVVQHMSDRVLVMRSGEIIESGTADEIFQKPRHDYLVNLIKSVPDAQLFCG